MRYIFCAFTFLFFMVQPESYAAISQVVIDQKVQAFVKNKPVKAMIYGLWIDGKPIRIHAIGESMTAVPADTHMMFRIGGITETILTTVLMQMVKQKKLNLNDTIDHWYPNLPNANRITLKMLANCTSGYPDYVYNKTFLQTSTDHPFRQWSDQTLIQYAMKSPVLFQPGMGQHYSHTDFVILGNILSRVSGMGLDQLLKSFVLKPLKMDDTHYIRTALMPSSLILHSFSQDRKIYEDATYWDPSWTSSSGAMVSTIDNLGKWANAWMNSSLLPAQLTQQLRAPETVGKGANKNNLYFAMGFLVVNHWLIQNPNFGGYAGIFAVLPEKKMVFVAFSTNKESKNVDNPNLSMQLFQELVADLAPEYPLPSSK